MKIKLRSILVCILLTSCLYAETAKDAWNKMLGDVKKQTSPIFAYTENDLALPNVFIYGDSVSIGYTAQVRDLLKGEANVYRFTGNGNDSSRFIPNVSEMLKTMRDPRLDEHWSFHWDVIHLNVGLHDLKHLKDNKLDSSGEQLHTLAEYEANLRSIFDYLKKNEPQAAIVFATTTPVPVEGSPGYIPGDSEKYNEVALKVLQDYPAVVVNDLYGFTKPNQDSWKFSEGNVHYKPEARDLQAKEVAGVIREVLSARAKSAK